MHEVRNFMKKDGCIKARFLFHVPFKSIKGRSSSYTIIFKLCILK